ncbi:stress response protein NhaX-like [Saccostrea cucullata]|uniref:stress response protein NhaX-like n=1 Tax=Saccostrea cuccullata TaxID=36930 RepID=UPI002ED3BC02
MSECRVLIAMDGSEDAAMALKYYVENIHRPGYYVILAHCAEYMNVNFGMVSLSQADPTIVERTVNEEEKRIHALIEQLNKILESHNLSGEVVRIQGEGNPGHDIIHKAKEKKADMIVTGSRGMGKLRRTFMGSVSDFLVHHSHIPVLVCKHEKHEQQH